MAAEPGTIPVEVAFALPDRQVLLALDVPTGCSALEAVRRSGIRAHTGDIDPETAPLGIFGHPLPDPAHHVLEPWDRVEIYRPLHADPKEARRRRARR